MNGDKVQIQNFQELLGEYFPRGAIQVLEDVRAAQHHVVDAEDDDVRGLLASLGAGYAR